MDSIIQKEKHCYMCGASIPTGYFDGLEEHHVFFGTGKRKLSEKRGLKVWLCGETCHRNGKKSVHKNREVDLYVKRKAQEVYEETYGTREDFIMEFGKSYL